MSKPDLTRIFSNNSSSVYNAAIAQGYINEENLVLALQTIKIAFMFDRITEKEKETLQNQIVKRETFDTTILAKLTKGERVVLNEINPDALLTEMPSETIEEIQSEVDSINKELNTLYKKHSNDDNSKICFICNEDTGTNGLACDNPHTKHFQCNNCFTLWLRVLNGQRMENFELLKARSGMVRCPFENCQSPPFTRSQVCTHTNIETVLENFLDNLQHVEGLKMFTEYQEKLLELTKEVSKAENDESGSDLKSSSQSDKLTDLSASDRMKKRLELESLAQSLKLQMPDARQCRTCGYGPMILSACDDLKAHHGEVRDSNTMAAINNSCPGCGYLASSWSEWIPWSGMLPKSLQGSAFCLGTATNEPAKVLTVEEAREARLKALERSSQLKKREIVLEPLQPKKKLTQEEHDEIYFFQTKRALELERQQKKNTRELMLRRFRADRE